MNSPIKRSTPPRKMSPRTAAKRKAAGESVIRSTIAGPRKKPKPRNAKRAKANHERAYGEYAHYIRSLPCCACGYKGPSIEAAHTRTGGMGRKADASTLVPLCGERTIHNYGQGVGFIEGCHGTSHRVGVKTFEACYAVNFKAIAASLWADWQKSGAGVAQGEA